MTWIIFLAVVGLILITLELYLPGGILGFAGGLCLFGAILFAYARFGFKSGNMVLGGVLAGVTVVILVWMVVFPKTSAGRHLITSRDLSDSKSADSLNHLMYKKGRTLTPLRQSGTALIDENRIDVLSETGTIDSAMEIEVVRVEGNRVFVRKTV
jgi:membrane-bound serine protease (ClpP class)